MGYSREKYLENRERILEERKAYYNSHRDTVRATQASYQKNNRSKINKRRLNRINTDIEYKIRERIRCRYKSIVRRNSSSMAAVRLLGCTVSELKVYLEAKFQPGMSWDNHGTSWHIDHVLPLSWFDLNDPRQQQLALNYTNLQPLWAIDNLRKGNRII